MKTLLKNSLLAILLFIAINGFAQTPTQNLSVSGLRGNVTVWRDGRGIPYIEAKTEADLYFAQGYAMASDRLWQMDLFRRVARGETAEIFGKATLEEDKRWRKFGFAQIAEENLKYTAPEVLAAIENYARGVNAYLSTLDEKTLPVEFQILRYRPREWKPADSIIIGYILADALSTTWQQDLLKANLADLSQEKLNLLFSPASRDDILLFGKDIKTTETQRSEKIKNKIAENKTQSNSQRLGIFSAFEFLAEAEQTRRRSLERIGLYEEFSAASNNWVISGKRTASGKPILANDPHLRASQPPIWYLINLSTPKMRVAGVTFPGSPGVILGHNKFIAWGATNTGPDVQDLYLETFNAENQYKTPKGWETPTIRKEEIKYRKNPLSPETETEVLEVVNTRNGVVFVESAGKKYSLKWTALDPKQTTFDAFYFLNHAQNWRDFQDALKKYGGAMQNFIYADIQGNIGWYAAGKIPTRKTGDGSLPYDGATSEGEWTGFIPFKELPHLYNPPQGFIVTANQRVVGTSYKYHDLISRVYVPSRAKRIYDLIDVNQKMTVEATSDIQMDTFSILNSRFAQEIFKNKTATDDTLKLLGVWDGRMNPDSKAALLVDEIRKAFRSRILEAAVGKERSQRMFWANEGNFFDKILAQKPKEWLPKEFASYDELLKICERDARESLTKRFGSDETKWTWGEANKIRFNHPLSVAPLIGAQFAVPVLPMKGSASAAASPNVGGSVSMRFIATPPDWDLTRHVINTGESGNPQSPNWADQLNAWYSGNTPTFPFSKPAVEKAAKQKTIMTP
jgi:penicillin G amidase